MEGKIIIPDCVKNKYISGLMKLDPASMSLKQSTNPKYAHHKFNERELVKMASAIDVVIKELKDFRESIPVPAV